MIPGNGNAVELRHIIGRIFENITNDTHGHIRRINIRITDHELFQNIILNRTRHDALVYALFLAGKDVKSQNWQYGAIHCHGNGHLIQRNTAEQNTHIENGINSNAGFADIAHDARIVRIITAMGRQIKCNGKAFLPGGQIAAIKRIGLFGR